ncbi:VOC family protein [Vannielia litorea]|uniref:PhnB protein n=1 Tax=Vannielia litorea TaxID=1217970 RepID=A0A1N6DZF9_9RHOB|nr:VOC family protein [Vannielia litorea]SIN76104.1 PhnB protein [Vannielia litorea]
MKAIPYLFYRGTAKEALETYARIFGSAAPEVFTYASMPEEDRAQMPGVPADAVMHGAVQVGDTWLYCSDDLTGEFIPMAGSSISVTLKDEAETERVFTALSEGGEVRMPLMEMFFSPAFGTLTDRFGIRWMVMADGEP